MRGAALRALVTAAESPGSGAVVYALMTRVMGIVALMEVPADEEPMPVSEKPVPFAGRSQAGSR
jgi:hypothetical protein